MQLESVFFVLVVFIVENDFLDGGVFKVDDFAALRALEGARVERVLVHGQLKAAARALHGVEDGVVFVLVVVLFVLVVSAAAGAGALIKLVFELGEIIR